MGLALTEIKLYPFILHEVMKFLVVLFMRVASPRHGCCKPVSTAVQGYGLWGKIGQVEGKEAPDIGKLSLSSFGPAGVCRFVPPRGRGVEVMISTGGSLFIIFGDLIGFRAF